MLKISIVHLEKKEIPKYPCLKEFNKESGNFIVLFTEKNNGVVVWVNENKNTRLKRENKLMLDHIKIGFISSYWGEESEFTPFNHRLILENK